MEDDILKVIKTENLLLLQNIFKQNWPYSIQPFMFLDNWIKWLDNNPKVNGEITCPDGDWTDGTFVAIIKECTYTVFFFSLQRPCVRLANALKLTKRIDWKKGPYLYCIHLDIEPECMKVLYNIGHPLVYDSFMICYWIPKKKARKYVVSYPNEYYSAPLKPEHAHTINAQWPHKFPGSVQHLTNLIQMNGGIGVFEKTSNKLCCWGMISEYGALAIVQTIEEHRRKKLASCVVKELSKRRAKYGLDSFANVNHKNEASKQMCSLLGFEVINTMRYIQFKKDIPNKI